MIKTVFTKIVHVMFTIFTAWLFIMALGNHCEVDIFNYVQPKSINSHHVMLYAGLAIAIIVILLFLYRLYSKRINKNSKTTSIIIAICGVIVAALSIFWIFFNDTVPHSDQAMIYEEARRIAGYNSTPYEEYYMGACKYMRLLVLLMSLLLRIFGDTIKAFQYFNVIMAVLLAVGMCVLVRKMIKDESATFIMSILVIFFYPIIIYSSYWYGTLAAIAFEVWGFYFTIRYKEFVDKGLKKTWRYAVLAVICVFIGIEMHMAALIGMVACIVYLVLNSTKKIWLKLILLSVVMCLVYLLGSKITDSLYLEITGCEECDAIPISARIYMGITADENNIGGPGSQDKSYWEIYDKCGRSAKATNEYILPIIGEVFKEYASGERNISFFVKKTQFQWLDPSVDAHRIILLNNVEAGEPKNSELFEKFYYSSLRQMVFKAAIALMIAIYGLSCMVGIYSVVKNKEMNIHFLVQIFFIGGFVFQLFYESISRYVMNYYIMIFIEAVYGISLLSKAIDSLKER